MDASRLCVAEVQTKGDDAADLASLQRQTKEGKLTASCSKADKVSAVAEQSFNASDERQV